MPRRKAKVLFFDDNRGRGTIKLLDSGERFPIGYKNISMEGFKVLYEGQIVEVFIEDGKIFVKPTEEENGNKI